MRTSRAFTLIELLVVIVIIALLAAMVIAVTGPMQKRAAAAQVVTNMKQLWTGVLNYTGQHDGELPPLGQASPIWGVADENTREAWYNSIPLQAGGRSLSSFDIKDEFYNKNNLLFVPSAKYPKNKISKPYFGVSFNEKLYPKEARNAAPGSATAPVSVRLQAMTQQARTIVFFESGVPGEEPLPGQNAYFGKASGWAPDLAARYDATESNDTKDRMNAKTNVIFGDGHVETLPAKSVISSGGGAHYPQLGTSGTGEGTVSWTMDPESNPNSY